jgi:hypothetical protein
MNIESHLETNINNISNRLYDVENEFMSIAGKRLKSIYGLNDDQIKEYLHSGDFIKDTKLDVKKVEKALAQAHSENLKDINGHFKNITAEVYGEGEKMAEFKNTRLSPLTGYRQAASPLLRRVVSNYVVMAKSTTVNDTYKKTIRKYVTSLATDGEENAPVAMRRAIRELTEQGISTIGYAKGRRVRMDSAVRNSLMTEYTEIVQDVERKLADEIGADGWEISAHEHCAVDHEPVQGHIFTNEEFEKLQNHEESRDVDLEKYNAGEADYLGETFQIDRAIGDWNCRHIAYPFLIGISEPNYSKKELDKIKARNEAGVEFHGKHYTLYEAEQGQRRLETAMRRERENLNLLKGVRDTDPSMERAYRESRARLAGLRGEYKALGEVLEPHAMRMKWERSYVPKGSTGEAVLPDIPPKQPPDNSYSQERLDNAQWFTDRNKANDYHQKQLADMWDKLTADEKFALTEQTGHYYKKTNEYLRTGKMPYAVDKTENEMAKKIIDDVTLALNKAELPQDTWVQRGMDEKGIAGLLGLRNDYQATRIFENRDDIIGNFYNDKGFLSTSVAKGAGFSKKDFIVNIYAPKGTHALYVDPISQFGSRVGQNLTAWDSAKKHKVTDTAELEMLFQQGIKLEIKKIEKAGNTTYIDAWVINQYNKK